MPRPAPHPADHSPHRTPPYLRLHLAPSITKMQLPTSRQNPRPRQATRSPSPSRTPARMISAWTTDVYNVGEVVEFSVINSGMLPLECANTPPDFRVTFQTGTGRWATRMGPETPVKGNISISKKASPRRSTGSSPAAGRPGGTGSSRTAGRNGRS